MNIVIAMFFALVLTNSANADFQNSDQFNDTATVIRSGFLNGAIEHKSYLLSSSNRKKFLKLEIVRGVADIKQNLKPRSIVIYNDASTVVTNRLLTLDAVISIKGQNYSVRFKSKEIYKDYSVVGYLQTEFDCFDLEGNLLSEINLIDHSTSSGTSAMAELQIDRSVYSIRVQ